MPTRRTIIGMLAACALIGVLISAPRLSAAQNPTRTPLPSLTPSDTPSLSLPTGAAVTVAPPVSTPTPAVSPTSPLLVVTATATPPSGSPAPRTAPGNAPPIQFDLPAGWQFAYRVVPVRVALESYAMNVAIYRGPLPNSIGTVIILWGFPSLAPPPTFPPAPGTPTAIPQPGGDFVSRMLWADGLRLLQGTVLDITCNVGTAGEQAFTIGGIPAVGTYFNVTGCQGEPDTAGWFAGVNQYGRNFLFYAYIEPIESYNSARPDMQRLLDTIRFTAPTTPTP